MIERENQVQRKREREGERGREREGGGERESSPPCLFPAPKGHSGSG